MRRALLLTASACALTSATAAWSQAETPPAAAPSKGLEEIVVTAQRRSENLQNVPVAVAAVTATQLARTGVSNVLDLRLAVPTLSITNSNNSLSTSLRGIGSNASAPGFENPVAIYVDGVYYASQSANYLDFNNVAQVEVLKGPQGTLFGRNATGGLVQIFTRTPGQTFVAEGDLSYGNYNMINGDLYVGGPLSDTLAADFSIKGAHQGDGWGTNLATGKDVYKVNHDISMRSKWVLTPTALTKITLIGDYSTSSDSMSPFSIVPGTYSAYTAPGSPAGTVPTLTLNPDRGYDVDLDTPSFKHGWAAGGSLRWDQKIGDLNLMSLTAYRQSRYTVLFDYDGGVQLPSVSVGYTWPDTQFSQELQLSSKSGGRFTWVLGAYYFNATAQYAPVTLDLGRDGVDITINNKQRTRSLAGYAQGTYEIFDRTHLTVGLRYTTERRAAYDGSTAVYVIPIATALPVAYGDDEHVTFNKLTFRVSLDHRFSDQVLGYASFNRGFKSGGFNTQAPGTVPYKPETIDAYEVGLKTDLFDKRLRINAAGYYYNYSDIQSQFLVGGAILVVNAAKARLYGLDLDFQARIAGNFRLTGGLGLANSRYTSYPDAPIGSLPGGAPSGIGSAKGNRLPLAADVTANIGLDYTTTLAHGGLDLSTNLYYNGGLYFEADNNIKQGRYAMLGASAKWTSPNGHYDLGLFGRNLTNKRILSFETTNPEGTHFGDFAAPRTYGVTAGFKF